MAGGGGSSGTGGFTARGGSGRQQPGNQVMPVPGETPGSGSTPQLGIPTWVDQIMGGGAGGGVGNASGSPSGLPYQQGAPTDPYQQGVPVQQGAPTVYGTPTWAEQAAQMQMGAPVQQYGGGGSGYGVGTQGGGPMTGGGWQPPSQMGIPVQQGVPQVLQQGIPTWFDQAVGMQMGAPVERVSPRPVGARGGRGRPTPPPTIRRQPRPRQQGAPTEGPGSEWNPDLGAGSA